MVDPACQSCTEIDLNISSLLAPPHTEGHHKCQAIPISKFGSWKHTSTFHKLPKTNQHHTLKLIGQIGDVSLKLATGE